jgi:hypothetical protein
MSRPPEYIEVLAPIDYRAMLADFRAAVWCEAHVDEADDARLLKNFHAIHAAFLRAIDRDRPQLFADVDRSFFLVTLRKWLVMYLRGVEDVRARYPRTDDSTDLVILGTNWSERLGIAHEGLDGLSIVSRYAEYWAERTITWATTRARGEGVVESYDDRLAFVGSEYYVRCNALAHAGRVLIRDRAWNAIPAFDLRELFGGLVDPSKLEAECARRDWLVQVVQPDARGILWETARDQLANVAV